MEKFKVLQLGRYFPPHVGGTESVIYDLVCGLNEKGVRSDVLCCNDYNKYEESILSDFTVIRTPTILRFGSVSVSPQQIFTLRNISKNYSLIHIHHPCPMGTLVLWFVRPSAKIVVYWHSDIVRQKLLLILFKPFQNWLLKRADSIVATTPSYESYAFKRYPNKTTYIPLGITGLKNGNSIRFNQLKEKYKGKKIVFSLGRLVEYKGYEYLIKSAEYLDDTYIILIGGDGKLKDRLHNQVKQYKLDHRVKLVGRIEEDELPLYFGACDLFCLSSISKNEAFGLVLPEAMSLAKPIVATKIPGSGVDWVNKNGVSGINVEIKNPQALAEAIRTILEDANLKEKYGNGALTRFVTFFRKELMIESFIKHYKSLLK